MKALLTKLVLIVCLLPFALNADVRSDMGDSNLSLVAVMQNAMNAGMSVGDSVAAMVTADASVDDVRNFARSQGMTTLREAGLKLIFDGQTTIDEVVRETVMEDVE